jgi:lipid II:glycine glycyltransferase (peptidoglycan interpeptide bridge formation enzyme)
MFDILSNYSIEVNTISQDQWYRIINDFSDASIYQTWSYDEIRFGKNKISHLIVKEGDRIVAATQVRIVKIPILRIGIAYVYWGPLWKRKNTETNTDIFRLAIRALKDEYAGRRGLLLRIYPALFSDEVDIFEPILRTEGFTPLPNENISRTLLLDLNPSLDSLRKGLHQKWRNCLNKAERNSLELTEGTNDEMFHSFIGLYRTMLDRKNFIESNDINEFRIIQKALPDAYKMKIMLCHAEGQLCAGAIFSNLGSTGLYLFGATNTLGMKSNGSYLIQWRFIEWLKEKNASCYDLNGINPVKNPGTYKFKEGLCGKNGKDVYFLGKYDVCENKLNALCMKCIDLTISKYKEGKSCLTQFAQYIIRTPQYRKPHAIDDNSNKT